VYACSERGWGDRFGSNKSKRVKVDLGRFWWGATQGRKKNESKKERKKERKKNESKKERKKERIRYESEVASFRGLAEE
jgi:hypothetical protein